MASFSKNHTEVPKNAAVTRMNTVMNEAEGDRLFKEFVLKEKMVYDSKRNLNMLDMLGKTVTKAERLENVTLVSL